MNDICARSLFVVVLVTGFASMTGRGQQSVAPLASVVAPLADLEIPAGFSISVFASGLPGARLMTVSPEGVLVIARRRTHEVVVLPDTDQDGRAEPAVILTGLTNAHSLAFKGGYLYIATTPAVMRVRWANGAPDGHLERFAELPSSTPSLHSSRTIRFGPDGSLYVSIGSSCNVCIEEDARRTTIQAIAADGSKATPYALGLRNASKHYGFPFFVGRNLANQVPELKDAPATISAEQAVPPALALPAHVAAADLRFYTGTRFPASYRHALFLALHGSTTIPEKVGYKVVRIVMKDGHPVGLEDFVTGWLKDDVVTGRPSGLATGADGALYISDDSKGFVHRVAHTGSSTSPGSISTALRSTTRP